MSIRPAALSILLLVAACGQAQPKEDLADPYAGLEHEILTWRAEIEAGHPACQAKIKGKGCEAFEVTCKGAQELTAADRAKGATAKLVAAMRFSARTSDGSSGKSGSAFAEFVKARGAWTHAEAQPVNPTSCAPF